MKRIAGMDQIQDDRTPEEKAATWGFVVATDSFLSNWGSGNPKVCDRSIVARPILEEGELEVIERVFESRDEFKRVRYSLGKETAEGRVYRPRLQGNDLLHIYSTLDFLPYSGSLNVGGHCTFGEIQSITPVTEDVVCVSTPSDAGFMISQKVVRLMLPEKYHFRDRNWRAWINGNDSDLVKPVVDKLEIPVDWYSRDWFNNKNRKRL